MQARKRFKKLVDSPNNVRFEEARRVIESFGFRLLRTSGSHYIFGRPGMAEQLNLQDVSGKAKPYQINQFLKIVERYNLEIEE
jgi:predicted RNA binding protein YcfA (HicA-like mRNA interferase family)